MKRFSFGQELAKGVMMSALVVLPFLLSAALSVREAGNGSFDVVRDGVPVACNVRPAFGAPLPPESVKSASTTAADGSRVWNRWCEDVSSRFRFEIVERTDGAVEVSMLGSGDARTKNRRRRIEFDLPAARYSGKPWKGVLNGKGQADGMFGKADRRWLRLLAADGLLFDFNPFGPSHASESGHGYRGIAAIARVSFGEDGGAQVYFDSNFDGMGGGSSGAKLVLREGDLDDYARLHVLKKFWYGQRVAPIRLLKFGAPEAGKNEAAHYEDGDVRFEKDHGWVGDVVRETHVGNRTGAYYSQVTGNGPATYRFAGLTDGWYVLTLLCGNWTGIENRFSVALNGEPLARDISIECKKARTIARCVQVKGGSLDVVFDGRWTISGLGLQERLYETENFFVGRGFWYVEGFEPANVYCSRHTAMPPSIATLDETIEMPEPGKETAGAYRELPRESDRGEGDLSWVREQRMWKLPSCLQDEFADKEYREKLFAAQVAEHGYNSVMINGMLSRHTFPHETVENGQKWVAELTRLAKRHGLKVIDHFDTTLLWGAESGFRTMLERFPQTIRDRWTNLPDFYQLCPNNPEMKKWLFEYIKRDVEAGVDGFQLDEVEFWSGCTCRHCRERFHRETGWEIPLDETHPDIQPGAKSEFAVRWGLWKSKAVTDWHVELRRYLKHLKPDLYLSMYSTTSDFVKSRLGHDCLVDFGRVMSSFGTEVMTANSIYNGRALLPLMKTKNVLTATFGTPVWNWFYDKTPYSNYFSWGLCALVGQVPLLNNVPNDGVVPDPVRWAKSSRPMKTEGARSLAEVALLFSSATRDRCPKSAHEEELIGLAQELDALHIPYDFVLDANLSPEKLSKYKVLFLGDAKILDEPARGAIEGFRAKGGRVYARSGVGDFPLQPSCAAFYSREVIPWKSDKYAFSPDLAAEADVRQELSGLVGDACFWKVRGAPEGVYTALWREATGEVCVHFLNGLGGGAKPGDALRQEMIPQVPFPELDEDIVFVLPFEGLSAVALSPDFFGERKLDVRPVEGRGMRVTLPKELFRAYTVVRVR